MAVPRPFWLTVDWIMAYTVAVIGGGFLVGGDSVVSTRSWYVIQVLPGGIRLQGLVMIGVGMALIISSRLRFLTNPVLRVFTGYCAGIAFSIFSSWWITRGGDGHIPWTAPWPWVAFAATSVTLEMHPISQKGSDCV